MNILACFLVYSSKSKTISRVFTEVWNCCVLRDANSQFYQILQIKSPNLL